MKTGLFIGGAFVLAWATAGPISAETVPIAVTPVALWKGGGQDVDPAATRVEGAGEPDAALFLTAFLGGPGPRGCAEYACSNAVPVPRLPVRVKAEVRGDAACAMVMIRFVDAEGTMVQWNLSKIDFPDWVPIERPLRPGTNGYLASGPKVRQALGTDSTSKPFPLVPPFRLAALLLNHRFPGDSGSRSVAVRRLEVEY